MNGECACPDSEARDVSVQGGLEGHIPLPGSTQAFASDNTTPLSAVEVVNALGSVTSGPYPGDSVVCVKEVSTPTGFATIGDDFPCLHLGCGHTFDWHCCHTP